MAMNTHTVLIKVKQMGARKVSRQMKGLVVGLASVGLAAVGMARQVIRASDEMTNLGNKSRVFARTQGEAANRMATVISTARAMNMEMSGVAEVMQRVSMSADQVGLSNEQVTKMVSNLSKATMLSGATAQEATGALRQFGQALAANRLSGQELNSILEQTPMIARLIADSMGVAVGELRALGKQGLITAKVMKGALAVSIDDLDSKFDKFEFPISALMVSARRESTLLINTFGELSGAADALRTTAENLSSGLVALNRSFAVGGPLAQKAASSLNTAANALLGLGAALVALPLVKAAAGMAVAVNRAGGLKAAFALIPHPVAKIVAGLALLAGGLFVAKKEFVQLEVEAKKNVKTLENLQSALATITNADATGIRFWKDQFDLAALSTEEFRAHVEALARTLDSIDVPGFGQVVMGDSANFEMAAQKQLAILKARKDKMERQRPTNFLPGIEPRYNEILADVQSSYDSLFKWLDRRMSTLAKTGSELPANLRAELSELTQRLDPNFKVDTTKIDLSRIRVLRKEITEAGRMTDEIGETLDRMVTNSLNNMAKLVPELDAMPGSIDTNSYAYKQLEEAAKKAGEALDSLTEFQERARERDEESADAKQALSREASRQARLFKELQANMDPSLRIQDQYNLMLQRAKDILKGNNAELTKYIKLLNEWKSREQIQTYAAGARATGDPLAQRAAAAASYPQERQEAVTAMAGLVGSDQMSLEVMDKILENMERRHEMNLQLTDDEAAIQAMKQGILEGELSAAELREGTFASMREGFASVAGPALDLGANIASITAAGVGGLSNALTELATTGKANFKELGMSFLTMITQMIVQMTVMMALIMVIKAVGGEAALRMMGLGSRAAGGPVSGGQPYVVGERGPELFVPPKSGSIKSNKETANMMGGQKPQVTIVNVDSAENTLNAMGSEEGENIILNVMQRNPEIMRGMA